jgi:hypothetical protein
MELEFASDFIALAAQYYPGPSVNISLITTASNASNAVPIVLGGFAVIYNLPIETNLTLDATVINGINSGVVTDWDDPSIKALNPNEVLSPNKIILTSKSSEYDVNTAIRSMLSVDEIPYSMAVVPWNQLSRIPSPRFSVASLVADNISVKPTLDSILNEIYPLTSLSYVVVNGTCTEIKEIVRFLNYTLADLEVRDNLARAGLGLSDAQRDEAIKMLYAVECEGRVMRQAEQQIARDLLYDGYWAWESSRSFWQNPKEFFVAAPIGSSIYLGFYACLLIGSLSVFLFSYRLYEKQHKAGEIKEESNSVEADINLMKEEGKMLNTKLAKMQMIDTSTPNARASTQNVMVVLAIMVVWFQLYELLSNWFRISMTLHKSKLQLSTGALGLGEFIQIGALTFHLSYNYYIFLCVGGFCWLAGLVRRLFLTL